MTQPLLLVAAALAAASFLASGSAAAQSLGGSGPRDGGRVDAAARPPMSPDTVLAQRGDLKVTRADYDVELQNSAGTKLSSSIKGTGAVDTVTRTAGADDEKLSPLASTAVVASL